MGRISRKQRKAAARSAKREAKRAARLRNAGPDESGNFGVNPYAARGHVVEVAPKELRSNPNSTQFPKRIATQRMIDRYRAHGHITEAEWRAGNALWELWCAAELNARTTSAYEAVVVSASSSMDARIAKRVDGATAFLEAMSAVPYRAQGVVRAVIIEDWSASDWARLRGNGDRDSQRLGMARLRQGLSALAGHLAY